MNEFMIVFGPPYLETGGSHRTIVGDAVRHRTVAHKQQVDKKFVFGEASPPDVEVHWEV